MSAWLVSPEHIGAMVAYGQRPRPGTPNGPMNVYVPSTGKSLQMNDEDHRRQVAASLAIENLKSLTYRYPDTEGAADWGPFDSDQDYILRCMEQATRNIWTHRNENGVCRFDGKQGAANIYQMGSCYAYQSCEHPEWKNSDAKAFIDRLQDRAVQIGMSQELKLAPWGYYEKVEVDR